MTQKAYFRSSCRKFAICHPHHTLDPGAVLWWWIHKKYVKLLRLHVELYIECTQYTCQIFTFFSCWWWSCCCCCCLMMCLSVCPHHHVVCVVINRTQKNRTLQIMIGPSLSYSVSLWTNKTMHNKIQNTACSVVVASHCAMPWGLDRSSHTYIHIHTCIYICVCVYIYAYIRILLIHTRYIPNKGSTLFDVTKKIYIMHKYLQDLYTLPGRD